MTDVTAKLTLYNSLSGAKEAFIPADPAAVTVYTCGPTVYSYAHIGNARAAVVADILYRVLRHIYGERAVIYARNITDIDDKIIKAAGEQNVPMSDITEKYARIYNEDLAALGCLAPTFQPKATETIAEMAKLIEELLDKDIAYISDHHVLFDVTKDDAYGKLSGRKLEHNLSGARVEVASYKKNPGDFVLWKPSKPGEPSYNPSAHFPPGRPGWHIECSAMIRDVLGETIDIHCGGIDLKFPHHENEIAQSECANGAPLARYWLHNEFLNMAKDDGGSDKMSKSLGNIVLVHDLLKDWDGEVIRLALLKAHYRSELLWSEKLLHESKAQLDGWYRDKQAYEGLSALGAGRLKTYLSAEMLDDLNIPEQLAKLTALSDDSRKEYDSFHSDIQCENSADWNRFVDLDLMVQRLNLLGLLEKTSEEWFKGGVSGSDEAEIKALIAEREAEKAKAMAAKAAGDKAAMGAHFSRSDAIRDELAGRGIALEDRPDGSTDWRRA